MKKMEKLGGISISGSNIDNMHPVNAGELPLRPWINN